MNSKQMIASSIVIFGGFLVLVYTGVVAAKWANNVSKQTEKNFADAIRVMQGDK